MAAASWVMACGARSTRPRSAPPAAGLLGRQGRIRQLPPPLSAWTGARDAPRPAQSLPPVVGQREAGQGDTGQAGQPARRGRRGPGMSARDEVLARIRRANATAARDPAQTGRSRRRPAGRPSRARRPHAAELMDLLAGRLADYRASVVRADAAGCPPRSPRRWAAAGRGAWSCPPG